MSLITRLHRMFFRNRGLITAIDHKESIPGPLYDVLCSVNLLITPSRDQSVSKLYHPYFDEGESRCLGPSG